MPAPPWPPSSEQINRLYNALGAAERAIPRDTFDPNAVVEKVGKDPEKLLGWVRENTDWVPYRGALRGPVGVLMDRLGNSLDRALLLAELLRLAGFEVRLATAALSGDHARSLLAGVERVPAHASPAHNGQPSPQEADVVDRFSKDFQLDAAALRGTGGRASLRWQRLVEDLAQRVHAQGAFLVDAVGRPRPTDDYRAKALAAASDHWWVERQEQGRWVALDPMLADAGRNDTPLGAVKTYPYKPKVGIIPLASEFCHEITIRIVIEQWKAGTLTEKTALAYSFRPAETIGRAIVLRHSGLRALNSAKFLDQDNPLAALKAAALQEREWVPYLMVGDKTIVQSSFLDNGDLNGRPGAEATPSGGLTQGFGGLMGGASPGESSRGSQLTAEWIEYKISVPGAKPQTVRRQVFDLLGPQARRAASVPDPSPSEVRRLQRALHLGEGVELLPIACRFSLPFVARQAALGAIANRNALSGMFGKVVANDAKGALSEASKVQPMGGRLFDLALARFEWGEAAGDVYIDTPNLLSFRSSLTGDANGELHVRQGFDIVINDVAVRPGSQATGFETRVAQGAADTNVEALLLGADSVVNAGTALGVTGTRSSSWVTIRGLQDPALRGLAWSADARALIEEDLGSGFLVVVPAAPRDGSEWSWWRVDPRTGQTLGRGSLGWGQAFTERQKFGAVVLVSVICALGDFSYCAGARKGSPTMMKDCLCQAGAVGVGAGGGFTAVVGMAAGFWSAIVWLVGTVSVAILGVECLPPLDEKK